MVTWRRGLDCIRLYVLYYTALFHSLTTDLDEIVTAVSGTQVHLVFGDITNETTDVIVNTTDFTTTDFQTGKRLTKDIFYKIMKHPVTCM